MVQALLYLQSRSLLNRLRRQVKRLKQPKYVVFAVVGALYFYFYFFRYLFHARGTPNVFTLGSAASDTLLYESIGALILLTIVLMAWIIPHERAALAFSEAEVAFLFPAPISRRGLIHFKLLRSQTAILFTTLLLTVVSNRWGGKVWIHAAGWWFILSILNLHMLGSSFARTLLLDRGISNWQRRLVVLVIVVTAVAAVLVWARRTMPTLDVSELDNPETVQGYVKQVLASGPAPWLLYPFRLVIRPYLAPNGLAFLSALPATLALLALHYLWVLRSNVAFEEASVEASRKLAEKVAAIRAGDWQSNRGTRKAKRAPFKLRPTGFQPVALLWKNLISAGQAFTLRTWIFLLTAAIFTCVLLRQISGGPSLAMALAMAAGMLMLWSMLLGPLVMRQDLRQDLPMADVLKTFPLRGWQIVLGELLAPAAILTGAQWLLLILALGLFLQTEGAGTEWPMGIGIGVAIAMVAPMLNLITLQIPNGAVLVFPAWFKTGKEGPQGVEATGQRLVVLLGQLIVFAIVLIPATIAFVVTFFIAQKFLSLALVIPLAATAAAVLLGIEGGFGVLLLGWLFDRYDLSAEPGA